MSKPKQYAVVWPKDVKRGDGGVDTFWVQCGRAFEHDPKPLGFAKPRIDVLIDATPIGWDGRFMLFPKEDP